MDKIGIIRKGELTLSDIFQKIRKNPAYHSCGAIVSFVGSVKNIGKNRRPVLKLQYECAEEHAIRVLKDIREAIIAKYNLSDLIIYHFVGELRPGDDTIYIIAIAESRKEAFHAAEEALERVKHEVPIWKKEITDTEEYWILGEEIHRT